MAYLPKIVFSDLEQRRQLWFGRHVRSETRLNTFYEWLGPKKRMGIPLALMDMWKAFETSTQKNAAQVAILYDKFHVMRHLGEALAHARKGEYRRLP
ncbi:MAG: transposase, partial [Nitrospirota bacterium]|nr:transposase [Nitrospirota bacterium]